LGLRAWPFGSYQAGSRRSLALRIHAAV
jgi:hypothetical protein